MPYIPAVPPGWVDKGTTDPCAGCNGVCGNAFCPKRMRITCAVVPVADPSTTMWIS